jgi:glycosyltransferase involved in cell wall biosynthesis
MMAALAGETINTWFDLGLFIDRIKEDSPAHRDTPAEDFHTFMTNVNKGVGFITFYYAIDGVTMEVLKYAEVIKRISPKANCHFMAGRIEDACEHLFPPKCKFSVFDEIDGFDKWAHYDSLFSTRLERGAPEYNQLIVDFWAQTLRITEQLHTYIRKHKINLLYLINVNSNPGNVTLALSTMLISRYMGIPVVSNNHDFYWEGGSPRNDGGPRDHFFTNYHLGEVFSLVETLFPWESRRWLSVNINTNQSRELIGTFGHNVMNVAEIGTAVDTKIYTSASKRRSIEVFFQLSRILSGYKPTLNVTPIDSVLKKGLSQSDITGPLLLGASEMKDLDFISTNLILLQPTRIVGRKSIEINFDLIENLFKCEKFSAYFELNPGLTITLMVTGPIADGHFKYFVSLLKKFKTTLKTLPKTVRNRVHLAFLFSEFDKSRFTSKLDWPLEMSDLYGIASMVCLPSETEGRGLPIIESAASGVPILCRRYFPENVYAEVIGEHLHKDQRLKVCEFKGTTLSDEVVDQVIRYLMHPQDYNPVAIHNRKVVMSRFSLEALQRDMEGMLHTLFEQFQPRHEARHAAETALADFNDWMSAPPKAVKDVLNTRNRQYLAGTHQLSFMILLKSLIDPSFFRVEEQLMRGEAMAFAKFLVDSCTKDQLPCLETQRFFYNSVDELFRIRKDSELPIRIDHAMAYRHRNRNDYPYQDLTPHELSTIIHMLFQRIVAPLPRDYTERFAPHHTTDWHMMLNQLCGTARIGIDHREELFEYMHENIPMIVVLGRVIQYELDLFVLQPVRARLKLAIYDELTEAKVIEAKKILSPIYIFQHKTGLGPAISANQLKTFLRKSKNAELNLLFKHGIAKVVPTDQMGPGIDARQLGKKALKRLAEVKAMDGIMIALNDQALMTTDVMDINRFHIGDVTKEITSHMLDVPIGHSFIQWVPPGLRFCLSYPVPVQTGKSFSETLKGPLFNELCRKIGRDKVLKALTEDAEERSSPIADVLKRLDAALNTSRDKKAKSVSYRAINGVYSDGLPWSGVMAEVSGTLQYQIVSSNKGTQTVLEFVEDFNKGRRKKAQLSWNGGYILNPELVGKLGIPETYIGSPLGLIVSAGEVLCPPLFNKPSLVVKENGDMSIERISCAPGITVSQNGQQICFAADGYNAAKPYDSPAFYDLSYSGNLPQGKRAIVTLAGNTIKDIRHVSASEEVAILPVGLTLSLASSDLPKKWTVDGNVHITMPQLDWVAHAIEAGPMLVDAGELAIDMAVEHWTHPNSIRTQAARLDYLDMRGPKIAAGINADGKLSVLAVNGRIRESVGATHIDMAEIMKAQGMVQAMGFDPGGSATLVVGKSTVNISPYNKDYQDDIYALAPQPRAVSNVVIGF